MEKIVLTIAGSDPSGGAGVQADLQTFAHFNVTGLSAITAITAQNEDAVLAVHPTPADILTQQLSTACKGKKLDAIKIGMVATESNVKALVWFLHHTPADHVVIDPILHSSSGTPLLESKAYAIYRQQLLPMATVITPNLFEAGVLAGMQVATLDTMKTAAEIIYHETNRFREGTQRPLSILIKGGHLEGDAVDVLFDGERYFSFPAKRIPGPSPRGTGCRFSSAIAACLALGDDLSTAIKKAKEYLALYISRVVDRGS
jgi:hydroxymethylpyrimidine/phosphomethylpyrimidine kinase